MQGGAADFFKLMGCYHCFHVACFAPWWRWRVAQPAEVVPLHLQRSVAAPPEDSTGVACPRCRAPIRQHDVAHVR
jgi:hypothetical protein